MTLKKLEPTGMRPATAGLTSKSIKILYVEDEDLNWQVTLLHLKERYHIERAKNAREVFERLSKDTFHAILMDIQLSGSDLDGVEITKALRGKLPSPPSYVQGVDGKSIPIIFMTAYSARYSRDELLKVGGDELVHKPVDFTQLGLCLTRCLVKGLQQK